MSTLLQPSFHDAYIEPQRPPKLGQSTDAAEYLERNRGSLVLVGNDRPGGTVAGTGALAGPRAPRVLGHEGEENERLNRHGTVGQFLYTTSSLSIAPQPGPRVKGDDGEEIARRAIHGVMVADILRLDSSRKTPSVNQAQVRVKGDEAETNAVHGRGVMDQVFNASRSVSVEPPAEAGVLAIHDGPRVACGSHEGSTNALNGRGTMAAVLAHHSHQLQKQKTSRPPSRPSSIVDHQSPFTLALTGKPPVPDARVKGDDGRQNYKNGTVGLVGMLISNYGRYPAASQPAIKAHGAGTEIARAGHSGTVARLMVDNDPACRRRRPKTAPAPAGNHRRTQNSGSVAACVNPRTFKSKRPTRRKLGLQPARRPGTAGGAAAARPAFGSSAARPVTKPVCREGEGVQRPSTAPPATTNKLY